MCFLVKKAIRADFLRNRQQELRQRTESVWRNNENIILLGNPAAKHRLPIFSFLIRDGESGDLVHPQLFTRMLSDVYGIQARGGCACAGPYAHRLLDIDKVKSEEILSAIEADQEIIEPGWARLNFSVLMTDEKVDFIIRSVDELTRNPTLHMQRYQVDQTTARFRLRAAQIVSRRSAPALTERRST